MEEAARLVETDTGADGLVLKGSERSLLNGLHKLAAHGVGYEPAVERAREDEHSLALEELESPEGHNVPAEFGELNLDGLTRRQERAGRHPLVGQRAPGPEIRSLRKHRKHVRKEP